MIIIKCKNEKCKHEWQSRVERPIACPKCKQYIRYKEDETKTKE